MKKELTPGNTYTVEEFSSSLRKVTTDTAKNKFLKNNEDGYFSTLSNKDISKRDIENLVDIIGHNYQNIYNFFIKNSVPFDIELKVLSEDKEEVKSNNIYDRMAARTITHYEGNFKVKISYNQPPITVTRNFSKDTTLSMRDIVSFM